MDQARKQYVDQLREYDRVIDDAIRKQDLAQLPKIRELNTALGKTLNKMIEDTTFLKKNTPDMEKTRDELLDRLRKIQSDYNGLKANTDQLETLRRIRKEQSRESNSELYMYLLFFLVVALCIVVLVFFMSGQKKAATAPIASIPPIAATLV
jgi:VIT1/CCC1 family predicted Fe2+/Mn2+ transporter